MARRQDTTLGELDFQAVQSSVNDVYSSSSKRGQYTEFSDTDQFDIGKYASEHGPAAAVQKFSEEFKTLNKSTVRGFCKKYSKQIKKASKDSRESPKAIVGERRGRPLMLGDILDKKIQD